LSQIPKDLRPALPDEIMKRAETIRSFIKHHSQVLANIRKIDLSNLDLTVLPPEIAQFTKLTHLSLDNTKLIFIPEWIDQLTELTSLSLNSNQLTDLPESIGRLSSLKTLHLDDNQLRFLPESIGKLKALTELWIDGNFLLSIPESIGQLSELRALTLSHNLLESLPQSIGNLEMLTNLLLTDNQIASLPESIGDLKRLENLSVEFNCLKELPRSICQPSNLKVNGLHFNPLSAEFIEFIEELDECPHLLSQSALEKMIADKNLCSFFDRIFNQIPVKQRPELPDSLDKRAIVCKSWIEAHRDICDNILTIDLSGSKISALPHEICNFRRLNHLLLNNTPMETLPEWLDMLFNLKYLSVNGNRFISLPKVMDSLSELVVVGLTKDQLPHQSILSKKFSKGIFHQLSSNARIDPAQSMASVASGLRKMLGFK
jgi:Leucine-rich repeat (LRR) protein